MGFFLSWVFGAIINFLGGIVKNWLIDWLWLDRVRGIVRNAIAVSDYKVQRLSGQQPLILHLTFKIHNGYQSRVVVEQIAVNICSGGNLVDRVIGRIVDLSSVWAKELSKGDMSVPAGGDITLIVQIIPPLWFWILHPESTFSIHLVQSTLYLGTNWGVVAKPLKPEPMLIGSDNDPQGSEAVKRYMDRIQQVLAPKGESSDVKT